MIDSVALGQCARTRHGFFTRRGGVSEAPYDTLNCGLGSCDKTESVRENRRRAMAALGVSETALATAYQVHSDRVAVVDRPWGTDQRPQVDGLVTRTPGLALGILTADCAPVLFADAESGVIGAAHAGWRGAKSGILEATVNAMVGLGARVDTIAAAVGPCIHQPSYEVGPEFHAAFVEGEPESGDLFRPSTRAGHYLFDLPGYVSARLRGIDLNQVEMTPFDTCADERLFFSYRRTTLNGGGDYGRGLSAIVIDG